MTREEYDRMVLAELMFYGCEDEEDMEEETFAQEKAKEIMEEYDAIVDLCFSRDETPEHCADLIYDELEED